MDFSSRLLKKTLVLSGSY